MSGQRTRPQYEVERIRVRGPFPLAAGALQVGDGHVQRLADAAYDRLLACTKIAYPLIETVSPKMRVLLCTDELCIDAHDVAEPANTAFKHIPDAEFLADLANVDRFALVRVCSVPRNDEHSRHAGKVGGHILCNAVRKVVVLGVAAQGRERQYD